MAQQILDRLDAQGVRAAGLCADSRGLAPGDVFLAYPGTYADGRRYIAAALEEGASAVLWEKAGYAWDGGPDIPNVAVEGLHGLAGWLAHLVYGRPSESLWLVGVTGTNGKTSVSQWIARGLGMPGRPCGVIGTLGSGFPGAMKEGMNTTPDAIELHRIMAGFLAQGAGSVAMEVSSIGLDQGRVNGVAFDAAVFTNLTRDHLEYHGSMEAYAAAKAKLFEIPGLEHAVLNVDDPFGRELARSLRGTGVERIGYTLAEGGSVGNDVDALFAARNVVPTPGGVRFTAVTPRGTWQVEAPLVGRFNVSNLLAVLATLVASGVPEDQALARLAELTPPAGRMQMLGGAGEPLVIVDYAHTPDALEQVLLTLREAVQARAGRLSCVFGCGGERDAGKRSLMGEVAARHADRVIVTSDNPRGEDPNVIIEAIALGTGGAATLISDRQQAISRAVEEAEAADVVLIAGKGHETYQEIRGQRLPFSDTQQATLALARRRSRTS